ncbi:MAG TPA: hypothetical protein VN578_21890 [Candidatus Binatia bacterium]|jgi:hypothetical protein|nr:hypothetical protein [Candidatus Binatia bacterium]
MARRLHSEDGGQSLSAQLATKGDEVRAKYGPNIGWKEVLRILEDRSCVLYPCEVRFDADLLLAGEFAHSVPKGPKPEEGFTIFVHPCFATQLSALPYLVLYQLALVTCGSAVSPDDAETFGCHVLDLPQDQYFQVLCELAEQLGGDEMI